MIGKDPQLPPTPSLTEYEFEDFTEALLSAHRYCDDSIVHVRDVERWGRRGDKQDGIDLKGTLSDGTTVAWQCKRQDNLTPSDVRDAVKAATDSAVKYVLVYSGQASTRARNEIAKHPNWELMDQRGLARMVNDLPLARRRELLDKTFGTTIRKTILDVPGEDAFWTIETFHEDRTNPDTVLNDISPLVGRTAELEALRAALDRSSDLYPIFITVAGPGGRGKTRLVTDVLAEHQQARREVPVLCLAPGNTFDKAAVAELPHGPAIIFIDDAHHDPLALGNLLTYARSTPGTQVILATRPSAADAIQTVVTNARFAPSDQTHIDVAELSLKDARNLVAQLSDGLDLNVGTRTYLAEQATHSPDLAVVTTNLVRRGELTNALPIDEGLRAQVLGRYQDLRTASIANFEHDTVRRVLATYTALRPDLSDQDLTATIANFCHLRATQLLRLNQQLADRGLITNTGNATRVVPDLLADTFLEDEAAAGSADLGFTTELWDTFGATHRERLITALAELGWRLSHRGGPDIMAPVWAAIDTRLSADRPSTIVAELERLRNLAYTHPAPLTERLETLRHRLNTAPPATTDDAEAPDAEDADRYRVMFGMAPVDADDIRNELPQLYANAAKADPTLFTTALDALWDLRRRDRRPPNQNSSSAARLIEDELANLNKVSLSYANAVVDRVEAWLAEAPQPGDAATPLFALAPLLAKEGHRFYAKTRWQWVMQPYAIKPDVVADLRARIRTILTEVAQGTDARRARTAVKLLENALRQPHGFDGHRPENEALRAWDADTEALLEALKSVAQGTEEPFMRRLVRSAVGWQADHAGSIRVQHQALELITALDNIDTLEDNLAESILHPGYGLSSLSRRGPAVPTMDQLEAERTAKAKAQEQRAKGQDPTEHRNVDMREVSSRVEARRVESAERLNELTQQLLELDDATLINALARGLDAAIAYSAKDNPSVRHLVRSIADTAPDRIPTLTIAAAAGEAGPLDNDLDHLISFWLGHDPEPATRWMQGASTQRAEVRRAVGSAFSDGWHLTDDLETVYRAGIVDPDPLVRNYFLHSGGTYLEAHPERAPQELMHAGISPGSARACLERAASYDGYPWGASLSLEAAAAVLAFIAHANEGGRNYTINNVTAGIAANHPTLVLEHLTTLENAPLSDDATAIGAAFEAHPKVLAEWLRDASVADHRVHVAAEVALSLGINEAQADALAAQLDHLDEEAFKNFIDNLFTVDTWASSRPTFTAAVYERARTLDIIDDVQPLVRASMTPRMWGGTNGESEELNRARDLLTRAVANTADSGLRSDFQDALAQVIHTIERDKAQFQEDRGNDF